MMNFHRPCLSEGGYNFLGEMPRHAAWDKHHPFVGGQSNNHVYKFGTIARFELGSGKFTLTVLRVTLGLWTKSPHQWKERAPNRGPPPKGISFLRPSSALGCTSSRVRSTGAAQLCRGNLDSFKSFFGPEQLGLEHVAPCMRVVFIRSTGTLRQAFQTPQATLFQFQ